MRDRLKKQLDGKRVYLLGAGFSKNISDSMPLMDELRDRIVPELGLDTSYPRISSNFENLLSFLAQDQPWLMPDRNLINQSTFIRLTRAIEKHVSQSQLHAMEQPVPPWLKDLMEIWIAENSTVITLNYDTLVESAFGEVITDPLESFESELGYQSGIVHAGFRGSPAIGNDRLWSRSDVTLLKLHGSINWFYSGVPRASGEPIYYTTSNKWDSGGFLPFVRSLSLQDKSPYIVPPLIDKTTLFTHEAFRLAWRTAASAIQKAEEVYILGYSSPVYDHTIKFLISQNANQDLGQKPRMFIANTAEEAYESAQESFPEYELDGKTLKTTTIQEVVEILKSDALSH